MNSPSAHLATKSPRGMTAMGIFLVFGALMATLAGTSLRWPRTYLDDIWILNPPAHRELAPYGPVVGLLFLLLGATLAVAAAGWFKRRLWGLRLAVAVFSIQLLGDFVHVFLGHVGEGAIGATFSGLLLLYLTRPQIRAAFEAATPRS